MEEATILERAARAIYAEYENRPIYAQGQMNGILARELARAVLQAIREPSEGMVDAGEAAGGVAAYRVDDYGDEAELGHYGTLAVWAAMIDSALSEGTVSAG